MDCAEGKREKMPMTSSVKDMSLAKEARNCAKGAKTEPKTMTAESHSPVQSRDRPGLRASKPKPQSVEEVALEVHDDAALVHEEAQRCRQTKHTVQVEEEAASSKVCGVETPSWEAGGNSGRCRHPPQPP